MNDEQSRFTALIVKVSRKESFKDVHATNATVVFLFVNKSLVTLHSFGHSECALNSSMGSGAGLQKRSL